MKHGEGIENSKMVPREGLSSCCVIPMLGHPLYTCELGLVPGPGKDLWLFCQCKGGHIKALVKWQRRGDMIGFNC
jgi:hypothetical protein